MIDVETVKLAVGRQIESGLPLQIESQGTFMGRETTTRVRYSGFDDPSIAVAAPAE